MTNTEFEIATVGMNITPHLRKAARRALVDGLSLAAADRELKLASGSTNQVVRRIRHNIGAERVVVMVPDGHASAVREFVAHMWANHSAMQAGKRKELTNANFIARSKAIHKGRYTYGCVDVAGYHRKVTITCPVHGDFEQRASSHLMGYGCRACSRRGSKKNGK